MNTGTSAYRTDASQRVPIKLLLPIGWFSCALCMPAALAFILVRPEQTAPGR